VDADRRPWPAFRVSFCIKENRLNRRPAEPHTGGMKHFPLLRSGGFAVQLRELSIGQCLQLAVMPIERDQAQTTAFLRFASVDPASDPLLWTVAERTFAVCHYLAITDEHAVNFAVGTGQLTDYVDVSQLRILNDVDIGILAGDHWQLQHLNGAMVESIERIEGECEHLTGRVHWLMGAMAAQLQRSGETVPDAASDCDAYDRWLVERMRVLCAFPESDFSALLAAFERSCTQLAHLFRLQFDDQGIVFLPQEARGDLPAARFPVSAALGPVAHALCPAIRATGT